MAESKPNTGIVRKAVAPKLVETVWPTKESIRIAIVGEAPGEEEALRGEPFVGASGKLLSATLKQAGIDRDACLITNTFRKRPPGNDVGYFFATGKESENAAAGIPKHPKGWLKAEWFHERERLREEITRFAPHVCLALGATATWALTGQDKITKVRGSVIESTLCPGIKVVPTYHPAGVMRQWGWYPVWCADILKCLNESEYPEIKKIARTIWMEPSLEDLYAFEQEHLMDTALVSYDIETDPWSLGEILCVGVSPSPEVSLVVPFVDKRRKNWHYWRTVEEEVEAWNWLKRILENPETKKVAQNGTYDILWLYFKAGIKVHGTIEDTMLMHHAQQPEMDKGLGMLSTMYTNETMAWKNLVNFKKGNKRDV